MGSACEESRGKGRLHATLGESRSHHFVSDPVLLSSPCRTLPASDRAPHHVGGVLPLLAHKEGFEAEPAGSLGLGLRRHQLFGHLCHCLGLNLVAQVARLCFCRRCLLWTEVR